MFDVDGISYNEGQRRELLAFVQRMARFTVVAWQRPDEDVVTMSKADCDKIVRLFEEAQGIVTRYSGMPL